jgi:DNA-binding phage protein
MERRNKMSLKKITTEEWVKDELEKYKDNIEYRLEEAILDFTEQICEQMEKQKITRAGLAERLGVSRAFITKLLNGNPNLTLKTMMNIVSALKSDLNIQIQPRRSTSKRLKAVNE